MAKILLTSSQVSVLISSIIVVLFTSALFLSGYVIQQRTLNELRIAIKPRPRAEHKTYLPDQFKIPTAEGEEDIIEIPPSDELVEDSSKEQLIEVKPTVPEPAKAQPKKAKSDAETQLERQEKKQAVDELKGKLAKASGGVEHPDPLALDEKPISRAERRRLIKEEIRRLSQADKPMYYQRRLW